MVYVQEIEGSFTDISPQSVQITDITWRTPELMMASPPGDMILAITVDVVNEGVLKRLKTTKSLEEEPILIGMTSPPSRMAGTTIPPSNTTTTGPSTKVEYPKLSQFDGAQAQLSTKDWIDKVDNYLKFHKVPKAQEYTFVRWYFTSNALTWLQSSFETD